MRAGLPAATAKAAHDSGDSIGSPEWSPAGRQHRLDRGQRCRDRRCGSRDRRSRHLGLWAAPACATVAAAGRTVSTVSLRSFRHWCRDGHRRRRGGRGHRQGRCRPGLPVRREACGREVILRSGTSGAPVVEPAAPWTTGTSAESKPWFVAAAPRPRYGCREPGSRVRGSPATLAAYRGVIGGCGGRVGGGRGGDCVVLASGSATAIPIPPSTPDAERRRERPDPAHRLSRTLRDRRGDDERVQVT